MLTIAISTLAGGFLSLFLLRWKRGSLQALGDEVLQQAQKEADRYLREAEHTIRQKENEHQRERERLKLREDKLEKRMQLVERKLVNTEKREAILKERN